MYFCLVHALWRLNRQQWARQEELQAIQTAKLREQLRRAWRYSEFYRERFDAAGFHPNDLKSPADLQQLPVLRREELRAAGSSAFCSDGRAAGSVWLKTSGTTGTPMVFPFTRRDRAHRVLMELRALFAHGYKLSDRTVVLRIPTDMIVKDRLLARLGLLRREYVSIFADEDEQIETINALRPEVIYGYASSLRILAERLETARFEKPTPKILISSADHLDKTTRRLAAGAFGVDPVDFYGAIEFGWIGWQCQVRQGYHINADCLIVECLRDGRPAQPGEEGEIVVTNLHSDSAPVIRYALGDTGVLSRQRCVCGRTLPLLARVGGRLEDCIVLPSGRRLSPHAITSTVEDVPGIRQFQVVQDERSSIKVRVVAGPAELDDGGLRAAVQSALGTQLHVIIERVESLPREPNGKFRAVKSFVTADDARVDDRRGAIKAGGRFGC